MQKSIKYGIALIYLASLLTFAGHGYAANLGAASSDAPLPFANVTGAESATSNDFDPDRIAGDTVDNDTLEGAVLTDGAITAAKAAAIMKIAGPCLAIGDYSAAIGTGTKWYAAFRVPFKHTLDGIYLTTNEVSGSVTIDVWSDAPGATNGLANITDADSLFDTATEPAIADASSDNFMPITSFDSGEAANAAGDYYVVNVDAAATLTGVSVCFDFTRVD